MAIRLTGWLQHGAGVSNGLCGVSTSTESTSAQSPTSCTMNPAACPYSHWLRSRIQTASTDSGADRNASATWLFTGATAASQIPNASSRQQAPVSVHPKDGWRLRTRNVSTAAITMEPTWYTPPTMAKYRYRVVFTAAYICASYCIFCGSSSTWADSIVSASAARTIVMQRQVLRNIISPLMTIKLSSHPWHGVV